MQMGYDLVRDLIIGKHWESQFLYSMFSISVIKSEKVIWQKHWLELRHVKLSQISLFWIIFAFLQAPVVGSQRISILKWQNLISVLLLSGDKQMNKKLKTTE